jgi:hypothetical protein
MEDPIATKARTEHCTVHYSTGTEDKILVLRGDNFSPRMPCQWYVKGGWGGQASDSDWSVRPPSLWNGIRTS